MPLNTITTQSSQHPSPPRPDARPGATPQEVEAAARRANAHTFISELKDGYDTFLGLGQGGGLSVGQRQRVAIVAVRRT